MENNAFVRIDSYGRMFVTVADGTFIVLVDTLNQTDVQKLNLNETNFPLPYPSVVHKLLHNEKEVGIFAYAKDAEKIRTTHFTNDEYENTSVVACDLFKSIDAFTKAQGEQLLYSARNKLTRAEMEALKNAVKQGKL